MNMACTLFGLTPEEAIAGMTINAARALGLGARGRQHRAPARPPTSCVWRIESLAELGYWIGLPGPERRICGRTLTRHPECEREAFEDATGSHSQRSG